MRFSWRSSPIRRGAPAAGAVVAVVVAPMAALLISLSGSPSAAAATAVDLGTAGGFGVLAGQSVTNTGPSVVSGDLGVSPGTAVTGFPPGTVLGSVHSATAVSGQAQSDVTTAYNVLAGQPSDELISADLADRTLTTGVYTASTSMGLSGELTLDAQGDPHAVFVFQVGSTLTTASASHITLTNGAQACNVFWQVGSSATLGTASTFKGTILALASISATNGATIEGRLLARTGSVTLINDTITRPTCATPTSDVPTSDVPTSDVPTSDVPTSDLPTTDLPTTDLPTTDLPTSDLPTSDLPVIEVPVAEQPAVPTTEKKQITNPPQDFPNTGDGGSVTDSGRAQIGVGALALLLASGLLIWWRRGISTD